MDRGNRQNLLRNTKSKDPLAYSAQIQAYLAKAVYIPNILKDAMTCPNANLWQAAWKSKLQSILDQNIFSKSVIVSKSHNTITAKIVWDIKYAKDNNIVRYKACLAACSFIQVYTVDYEKTFTPTICYDNFCIFLAISAKNNWKVYQVDIIKTLLSGKLDEVIYLWLPHFLRYLLGDYVQVLQRIYGLK